MRNLIYYVASSVDGYIAEPDGSFDKFPMDETLIADYIASFAWFDDVIMGRKTYDVAYRQGMMDPYPMLKTHVYTQTITEKPADNVSLVAGKVIDHVKSLKSQDGKPIWLCGGGNLAGQLYNAGLIDKLIVKLNPILLGDGIPMFSGAVKFARLNLTETREYDSGISVRHYDVTT